MSGTQPGSELIDVRIVDIPVAAYREAAEHGDELRREFALIREQEAEGGREVPRRLLRLVDELGSQFSGFTTAQEAELQDAVARGLPTLTLHYRVPPSVKEACLALAAMLDEADEFCREGQELLTLATPPRAVAFRTWFLDQFVRQVDGKEPTRWEDPT